MQEARKAFLGAYIRGGGLWLDWKKKLHGS